jgi:hypothetical protein
MRIRWNVSLPGKEVLGYVGTVDSIPAFRLWLETLTNGHVRWVLSSNMFGQILDVVTGPAADAATEDSFPFLKSTAEDWFTRAIHSYGADFPVGGFGG